MPDEPRSFFTKKRIAAAVIAVLVISIGAIFFVRRGKGSGAAEFITAKVERGNIRKVVNATGTVQAVLTVQVGSQLTGQVAALYADYNSVVKQGQLLGKIDARRFQADVSGAQANLLAAQARQKAVEADLNSQLANQASSQANVETQKVARDNTAILFARAEELQKQGITSKNDYDNAKANRDSAEARYNQARAQADQVAAQTASARAAIEQAKAQVEQAQAALNQARVNLEYTDIRSPVDGVVISRNVDVGQTVAASLQAPILFTIAGDLTKMQLRASVDEADIGTISQTDQVRFTVDAFPNRNFTGRIAEIRLEPLSVQNVVTYNVIVNVDNDQLELKPGMTANLTFAVAEKNDVLRLPNAALRYTPPGQSREQGGGRGNRAGGGGAQGQALRAAGNAPSSNAGPDARADRSGNASGRPQNNERIGRRGSPGGANRPGNPAANSSAALAPGQMWQPGDKIQFPASQIERTRPSVVWILNARNQPELRHVELGITDGSTTEVVSGELNEGDTVIIGDSTQAAQSRGGGGFFGGGPGGGGPGGPR